MEAHSNVFENEKLTVTYDPKSCINASLCARQLSEVFRQAVIPWIDLEGASTKRIIKQIKSCPSGALTYRLKNNSKTKIPA